MKQETLLEAMELLDDNIVRDAKFGKIRMHRTKKPFMFAAAVLCAVCAAVPVCVAADFAYTYEILYMVNPTIAQALKPVRMSCEDNGIRLEVVSANVEGNRADIYLALQDVTGERELGVVDLFDSYSLRTPLDCAGHCSFAAYDETTKTAYCLVTIETLNGKELNQEKVTFSLQKILINKQEWEGAIPEILMDAVPYEPETRTDVAICGMSWDMEEPDLEQMRYLVSSGASLVVPMEGAAVTGIGYVDDTLHVQLCFSDIAKTDNHGYVYLADPSGETMDSVYSLAWNEEDGKRYEELVFEVPYESIADYQLFGRFIIADPAIEGEWQVTFALE